MNSCWKVSNERLPGFKTLATGPLVLQDIRQTPNARQFVCNRGLKVVLLRATQKVLRNLQPSRDAGGVSGTALGDWYVNRVVVDRQPLLLFVGEKSLLAALAPARDVKNLATWFPGVVFERLKRMDVDWGLIGSEMEAMQVVQVGRTKDRSVTGQMVDFAKTLPYLLPEGDWGPQELRKAEVSARIRK
jgi:hypothetical protein